MVKPGPEGLAYVSGVADQRTGQLDSQQEHLLLACTPLLQLTSENSWFVPRLCLQFRKQLKKITGREDAELMHITFQCKAPGTGA